MTGSTRREPPGVGSRARAPQRCCDRPSRGVGQPPAAITRSGWGTDPLTAVLTPFCRSALCLTGARLGSTSSRAGSVWPTLTSTLTRTPHSPITLALTLTLTHPSPSPSPSLPPSPSPSSSPGGRLCSRRFMAAGCGSRARPSMPNTAGARVGALLALSTRRTRRPPTPTLTLTVRHRAPPPQVPTRCPALGRGRREAHPLRSRRRRVADGARCGLRLGNDIDDVARSTSSGRSSMFL